MKLSYKERDANHAPEKLETQARRRRLKLFKSLTGLKEVRRKPTCFKHVPRAYRDHTSFWSDGRSDYVLCEPYNSSLPMGHLPGLSVIGIPIEVGPYGGGWSDDPAVQPGTKSLLFGLSRDEARLSQLDLMLHAEVQWLPRWNEVATDKASEPVQVSLKVPALLKGDLEDCLSDPESGVRRGS
jgi:hypothetical protein